jgi:hypothetical protein
MKRYKKIIISIIFILILIISAPFVVFVIDCNKIDHGQKPIFCSKYAAFLDGGTIICEYKGYQIIRWSHSSKKRKLEVKILPGYSELLINRDTPKH